MSYCLLPSKNTSIEILHYATKEEHLLPCISPSLDNYLQIMKEQVEQEKFSTIYNIEFLQKIINTYEFIFTKVPGTKFSVGKMKPQTNSFYSFFEIITILNLFENFQHRKIKTLLYGSDAKCINECIDILRENYLDSNNEIDNLSSFSDVPYSIDFFYFEIQNRFHVKELLHLLSTILNFQSENGNVIIKVSSILEKPILDVIYILTSLYEKIYIIKPNASNLFNAEKFIVCKNYKVSIETIQTYLRGINSLLSTDELISSIIKSPLPYYFLTKVEEANIIIGHQQLEIMEQMINLMKNKNIEDKIETIKKNNIQKCVQWCEKYKIPYNKFSEKVNIFMSQNVIVDNEIPVFNEEPDDPTLFIA
jgi:hypothetical protein